MSFESKLISSVKEGVSNHYEVELEAVEIQPTRKDFKGDVTVVIFPMLRQIKGNPVAIGEVVGAFLKDQLEEVVDYNVVKGFLNLSLSDGHYLDFFYGVGDFSRFGTQPMGDKAYIVEFSSPNTNKPLHLGHIRNILLGYSVSKILEAAGNKVYKTQIINDRGIHICKSMLAWKRFANGETPASTGIKGDKFVGNYYVMSDKQYRMEVSDLIKKGIAEEEAKKTAPFLLDAQEMLRKWEQGDTDVVALWEKMNQWVYDGFEQTYKALGADFDSYYYESNTYLLGKKMVEKGLAKGVFYKKDDGSVWCDLTDEGLDEKLLLRSDGTAVYMTQDIGTAIERANDHPDVSGMIYTVGNEQDYHFKVLFLILKKLGYSWAKNLHHLSYGMVDLPSGKMKTREGTVVDADDLISEMAETAGKIAEELGKIEGFGKEERERLFHTIGMGALKYFILKVDPRKRILFDPRESVDFQGNTGPFIQYTYARIQSILRKVPEGIDQKKRTTIGLHHKERELLKALQAFPEVVQAAAQQYSPALIANYTYDLVKDFNSFYQNVSILGAEQENQIAFRVQLSSAVADVIKTAFSLLGIDVPEQM